MAESVTAIVPSIYNHENGIFLNISTYLVSVFVVVVCG